MGISIINESVPIPQLQFFLYSVPFHIFQMEQNLAIIFTVLHPVVLNFKSMLWGCITESYSQSTSLCFKQVSSDGRLCSQKPLSGPILTVTLFGRLYEKDSSPNAFSDPMAQVLRVMLIVVIPIVYSLSWQNIYIFSLLLQII